MVTKRAGSGRDESRANEARGSLRTLIGILGDVAQVTGVGIRFF